MVETQTRTATGNVPLYSVVPLMLCLVLSKTVYLHVCMVCDDQGRRDVECSNVGTKNVINVLNDEAHHMSVSGTFVSPEDLVVLSNWFKRI